MKKFDLNAIGNALVDTEIMVADSVIDDLGIKKGSMTLIDDKTFNTILSKLSSLPTHRACGGSAANTLITSSHLGLNCFYNYKVGADNNGQFYTKDIEKNGITGNNSSHTDKNQQTGACIVLVTPDAERTMCTYLGVSALLSANDVNIAAIKSSNFLYIEGYLAGSESGLKAGLEAKKIAAETGIQTALTLSDISMIKFCKEGLDALIGSEGISLLFCNETEAMSYTQTDNAHDAAKKLKSICKLSAITLGKNGALITSPNEQILVNSPKTNAINTNGAGDTFAGAFLAGIQKNLDIRTCGIWGCTAASYVVSQFGPRLEKKTIGDLELFAEKRNTIHQPL